MIAHPEDKERGIDGSSDLYSPGYLKVDLAGNTRISLLEELTSCFDIFLGSQ